MESTFRDSCPNNLKLIETLFYSSSDGFARLGFHIERLASSATRLGIPIDLASLEGALMAAPNRDDARVRLTLGLDGMVSVVAAPAPRSASVWMVAWSDTELDEHDPWLSIKSTQRALYDTVRADLRSDLDEMLFLNSESRAAEGTITNIFVADGDHLLTPPVSDGALPGVMRASLLAENKASEARLTRSDVENAEQAYVGNSLRGLIPIQFVKS